VTVARKVRRYAHRHTEETQTVKLAVIWTEVEYRYAEIEVPDGRYLGGTTDDEILSLAVASPDAQTTETAYRHFDGAEVI
jgi:hypothetical protein